MRDMNAISVWVWTIALAGIVVIWFYLTTDLKSIETVFVKAGPITLTMSSLFFALNSALLIYWHHVITQGRRPFRNAFRVAGSYMLTLIILPSRLGDVAWMYLMHKWLGLSAGTAVFVALYHRLIDFIIICMFFLLAGLIAGTAKYGGNMWIISSALFVLLVFTVLYLEKLLALAANLLISTNRRFDIPVITLLLRQLLQVRIWYRHSLTMKVQVMTVIIVLIRWLLILLATAVIIYSVAQHLDLPNIFFITNVYVFVSIIPVHAFGGFGIGEASLTGLLVAYNVPLGVASATGLIIRLMINLVHFAIWLTMVLFFQLFDQNFGTNSHS